MKTPFSRTLRLNSPLYRGNDVLALQTRLGIAAAQCDGIFGSATQRAVIAFQKQNQLTPDGVVGRKTWAGLFGQESVEQAVADTTQLVLATRLHISSTLSQFHSRYPNSIKWRLTPDGLEIEGTGIDISKGEPKTVRRVCQDYKEVLEQVSKSTGVPVELLIATMCTEAFDGNMHTVNPRAERKEPGYVSDAATPHRVSYGLMQTLISTARHAISQLATGTPISEEKIDRDWLFVPVNSLLAGAAYIASQSKQTQLDPPLVACAYNAGSVIYNIGVNNRWKMRQYPIGTDAHANRFVQWFNDCFRLFKEDGCPFESSTSFWQKLNPAPAASVGVTSQGVSLGETAPQPIIRTYLDDDAVVLSRGSIDTAGAKTYGKPANVPDEYVVTLQNDLSTLGFRTSAADGVFGSRTIDALKAFQECALNQLRQVNGQPISVTPSYQGDPHGECDKETRQEIKLWLEKTYRAPAPSVPAWKGVEYPKQENSIPFAVPTAKEQCWPIITRDRGGREVAYRGVSGKIYGRAGRRFLADRAGGRYHVGVDLWGEAGDIIVACEDGEIVNHYHFYNNVHALFEQCDSGLVINYGEVKPDSWREFGVKKGSRVKAGQPIARVGQMTNSSMCHFEMYIKGTTENQRYYKGTNSPKELLNPTQYLLHLAELGLSETNHGVLAPLQTPDDQPPSPPDFAGKDLLIYHSAFTNGVRWRLTRQGLEIEGSGIERTHGTPTTITKIWENFGDSINRWAAHFSVPCALIMATIATETSGNANAIRKEPGYESDSKTPSKISTGLMQTLISTARDTLEDNNIDRDWLLVPDNSIKAGTSYIAGQRSKTLLDPPKVACAYNAGSLKENTGTNNRWKMKQFPIGTSEHCDRYVKWFNDAVAVLETHAKKPSVPYDIYFS